MIFLRKALQSDASPDTMLQRSLAGSPFLPFLVTVLDMLAFIREKGISRVIMFQPDDIFG